MLKIFPCLVCLAVLLDFRATAVAVDVHSFDAALVELRAGRFLAADNIFVNMSKEDKEANPHFYYFASEAAFGAGFYRRAKAHIDEYLLWSRGDPLYQHEAETLNASIEHAIAAFAESDDSAFEYAQQRDTIFAYAAYRRFYPDGKNVAAADFLSFERAKQINVEVAYKRYVENWPDGRFLTDAKRSADRAAFKEARRQNTFQSYQSYLADYPAGLSHEQAAQRQEALAFFEASKNGSVAAIKLFLAQYPNGRRRAEAEHVLALAVKNAPMRELTGLTVGIPPGTFLYKKPGLKTRSNIIGLEKSFTAMAHEVTFEQWDKCLAEGGCNGYRPSDMQWGRGQRPVINVNRQDVDHFVVWFNEKWQEVGGAGIWRLPTEIEWAYMARGSNTNISVRHEALDQPRAACPQCDDAGDPQATLPVGLFRPNNFGLYDMLGNVAEWVADCWHEDLTDNPQDGSAWTAPTECSTGVVRGSLDSSQPVFFALQARHETDLQIRSKNIGFRLVQEH